MAKLTEEEKQARREARAQNEKFEQERREEAERQREAKRKEFKASLPARIIQMIENIRKLDYQFGEVQLKWTPFGFSYNRFEVDLKSEEWEVIEMESTIERAQIEQDEKRAREARRKAVLDRLTPEERELLGV